MRLGGHIVLLGEMGSGKTSVGEALAVRLGWPLADSDKAIEASQGVTGAVLAAELGVSYLHALERQALTGTLASPVPTVIAAAASVVDDLAIRAILANRLCIWLVADPDVIASRISGQGHRRELAPGEEEIIDRRVPLYKELATHRFDTTDSTPSEVAAAIASRLGLDGHQEISD